MYITTRVICHSIHVTIRILGRKLRVETELSHSPACKLGSNPGFINTYTYTKCGGSQSGNLAAVSNLAKLSRHLGQTRYILISSHFIGRRIRQAVCHAPSHWATSPIYMGTTSHCSHKSATQHCRMPICAEWRNMPKCSRMSSVKISKERNPAALSAAGVSITEVHLPGTCGTGQRNNIPTGPSKAAPKHLPRGDTIPTNTPDRFSLELHLGRLIGVAWPEWRLLPPRTCLACHVRQCSKPLAHEGPCCCQNCRHHIETNILELD